MFKSLFKFLKKLLKWLLPILAIAAIVIAVFFPAMLPVIGGWLSTAWTAVGGWLSTAWGALTSVAGAAWSAISTWVAGASIGDVLKLAAGAAILIDPEGAGEAAGSILGSLGTAVTSFLGSISPVVWVGGALFLLWYFSDDQTEERSRDRELERQLTLLKAQQQQPQGA